MLEVKDFQISVVGLGRSGVSLVRTLTALGARVLASDARSPKALDESLQQLGDINYELEVGAHTSRIYQNASMVVISPGVPFDLPVLQEARAHGVHVVGEVELAYRLSPAPILAVTGTNGKSTTVSLIHAMLVAAGRPSVLAGNIGIPLVGEVVKADPLGYVVAEISSFQLESIETFRPHVAMALNVTSDHLDRHASFEAYVQAKQRLFENQREGDVSIVNDDDASTRDMVPVQSPSRRFSFSRRNEVPCGCWASGSEIWQQTPEGRALRLIVPPGCALQGTHNLENILAAATVGLALNLPGQALVEALQTFQPLHFRMERVATLRGVEFINDSKGTNPGAVVAALESIEGPIILVAGGKDKMMDFGSLADVLVRRAFAAVLIGESAPRIEQSARERGFDQIYRAGSLQEAVQTAFGLARPGDTVLLSPACASFDMFRSAEDRGEIFTRLVLELKEKLEQSV